MDETVARLRLLAVLRDGRERTVEVLVGKPRPGDRCWVCPVSLPGIHEPVRNICGEDSLQALTLALYLVAVELWIVIESGGQLLHPEDREPFPLEAYFQKPSYGKPGAEPA